VAPTTEPLSNLDDELNLQLRGEILRLHGDLGFTLIYVTHNRDEAEASALGLYTSGTAESMTPPPIRAQRRVRVCISREVTGELKCSDALSIA
jgi:ABC-type sulfate/molybdate transport systems ATPase subunit